MLPTVSMKPGQLVPNWKDMVMPETTPMAKESAKTFTQKVGRHPLVVAVRAKRTRKKSSTQPERDGDRREQDVKRDVGRELDAAEDQGVEGFHVCRPLYLRFVSVGSAAPAQLPALSIRPAMRWPVVIRVTSRSVSSFCISS
jgi:hypothetical protein